MSAVLLYHSPYFLDPGSPSFLNLGWSEQALGIPGFYSSWFWDYKHTEQFLYFYSGPVFAQLGLESLYWTLVKV